MNQLLDTINAKTTARVRSYFESRDDWNLSRSLKNLVEQAIRDYEHRALLELVQNAHDAHPKGERDGRILIRLDHDAGEYGTVLVANSGHPFTKSNFDAICDVAQSDKRADEGIGNKGIGFKSTLQLCRVPEVYSASPSSSEWREFDGYCFRFVDEGDLLPLAADDPDRAAELAEDVFHLCLPIALGSVPDSVRPLAREGYVTVIRLPLKSEAARDEARRELRDLEGSPPAMLFLRRISTMVIEEHLAGTTTRRIHQRVERLVDQVDANLSIAEVDLGGAGRYLVAERVVDDGAFKTRIAQSVEADRISEGWRDWEGEAHVGVAVPLEDVLGEGRLYTFLPMGEHAGAPLPGHVNAPFFAKLARVDFEESVPLNDFLLDEIAELCASIVSLAASRALAIAATTVADLLSWKAPAHDRLVRAFDRGGMPISSAKVLPLRSPAGAWADFATARCWEHEGNTVLTSEALSHTGGAALIDDSIVGIRLDRLHEVARRLVGHDLRPSGSELADWAESIAAAGTKSFDPRWWEILYDELAGAVRDPTSLRGRRILIDDDGKLQRCADPEAGTPRGPTPFFSPRSDDEVTGDSDADLRIPRTLKRQIFFVNQQLRWNIRTGQTTSRRAGRRMLETGGLVNDYRAAELFAVIGRAMRNSPSDARSLEAIRWIYRFTRAREEPPWSEIAKVGLRVPTADGRWISAQSAFFSSAWGDPESQLLEDLIKRATEISEELARLRQRLLCPPEVWPFKVDSVEQLRQFLERVGVRTGLWPQAVPRSVMDNDGRWFEDGSATTSVSLPPGSRSMWKQAVLRLAPRGLRPFTRYQSRTPQYRLPGQEDYERFDNAARRSYAHLVVYGLERWNPSMMEVTFRRWNDSSDRFTWPTPAYAFMEQAEWLLMADAGERNTWYFVAPSVAWSHGGGDEATPSFAPLVPHALRRIAEPRIRSQARLTELGVQYWDTVETAPARIRLLARLLADDKVPEAATAAFKKAYEDAWADLVEHSLGDPFEDHLDSQLIVTRRTRLALIPLKGSTDDAEPIYVQDVQASQSLRLLEQRGAVVLRLRHGSGSAVAEILARHFGARLRRVSQTVVTVRVDGRAFEPCDAGELLITEDRLWLLEMITALVELRSGRFRRLGPEAIRRTVETLRRIRIIFAQHLEILIDGEPVEQQPTGSRVLALADPAIPTVALERSDGLDGVAILQQAASAIAELIGHPDLADTLRVTLIDLQRVGWADDQPPTLATIAELVGEPEERLREITADTRQATTETGRLLVPLLATFDVGAANDLWQNLEGFPDPDAIATWLAKRSPALPIAPKDLLAASEGDDLNAARVALGISLRELNTAIDALGPPFQRLRNPEGINQAFRYFVLTHRERILAALRIAFAPAYRAFEPLHEYLARRDLGSLAADPSWPDDFFDVDDDIMRRHVDAWLAEVGAPSLDSDIPDWPPLDQLRASNRARLHEIVAEAVALVAAWERKHAQASSHYPGEPAALVEEASQAGYLDFEPLSDVRALTWLAKIGRWPANMPRTLAPAELGLFPADVEAASRQCEDEARRRRDERRQISIDGTRISAEEENYATIAESIRAGITPELLSAPATPMDLDRQDGRQIGPGRPGSGVTAARRSRLSEAQAAAVGLAGEVIALEWLKTKYPNVTDAAWRSGYRNLLLGGNEGNDSLGYDFEVVLPRQLLFFEVKATVGDAFEFDLTQAEIRAAQMIRRSDRYYILFITKVLNSDERSIYLLPNPLGAEGIGRYRTVGSGLKLRFSLS